MASDRSLGDFRHLLKDVAFPANVIALLGILLLLTAIFAHRRLYFLSGIAAFALSVAWHYLDTSFAGAVTYGDEPFPSWWET